MRIAAPSLRRLTTWLVLGTAVALAYASRRLRHRARVRRVTIDESFAPQGSPTDVPPGVASVGRVGPPVAVDVHGAPEGVDLDQLAGGFDEAGELHVEEFRPAASPPWDAEQAEAEAEAEIEEAEASTDEPTDDDVEQEYSDPRAPTGSGELYDVYVTPAVDRELPEDDIAEDEGENWLEHLGASAGEYGPEPEHVIDAVDDSDPHAGHHKTDTRDTPVADRGSGGPRGL